MTTPHIRKPLKRTRRTARNWVRMIDKTTYAETLCGEPVTDRDVTVGDAKALDREGGGCHDCIRLANERKGA